MVIKIILSLLIGVLIGYNIGYRKGKKNIMQSTINSMMLILKERSLIKGYCVICNKEKPLSK